MQLHFGVWDFHGEEGSSRGLLGCDDDVVSFHNPEHHNLNVTLMVSVDIT
jgi:hypothetical protein